MSAPWSCLRTYLRATTYLVILAAGSAGAWLPAEAAQGHEERADAPGQHHQRVCGTDARAGGERVEHVDHLLEEVADREHGGETAEERRRSRWCRTFRR